MPVAVPAAECPMANKRRWQFSLSTALVTVLAFGVIIPLNWHPIFTMNHTSAYGWPTAFIIADPVSAAFVRDNNSRMSYWAASGNIAYCPLLLVFGIMCQVAVALLVGMLWGKLKWQAGPRD